MDIQTAEYKIQRAISESIGILDLAEITGRFTPEMREMMAETLRKVTNDDEIMNALIDADMRKERKHYEGS